MRRQQPYWKPCAGAWVYRRGTADTHLTVTVPLRGRPPRAMTSKAFPVASVHLSPAPLASVHPPRGSGSRLTPSWELGYPWWKDGRCLVWAKRKVGYPFLVSGGSCQPVFEVIGSPAGSEPAPPQDRWEVSEFPLRHGGPLGTGDRRRSKLKKGRKGEGRSAGGMGREGCRPGVGGGGWRWSSSPGRCGCGLLAWPWPWGWTGDGPASPAHSLEGLQVGGFSGGVPG